MHYLAMHYLVTEPGKDGGKICTDPAEAVQTAIQWYEDTGVPCVIWIVTGDGEKTEYGVQYSPGARKDN